MTNDDREQIEELHGLWELAVVRLATLAEVDADAEKIDEASRVERETFTAWKEFSHLITNFQKRSIL